MKQCAEQAPFGMADRTIVDKSVRDTWEIDAAKVSEGFICFGTQLNACLPKVGNQENCHAERTFVAAVLQEL